MAGQWPMDLRCDRLLWFGAGAGSCQFTMLCSVEGLQLQDPVIMASPNHGMMPMSGGYTP